MKRFRILILIGSLLFFYSYIFAQGKGTDESVKTEKQDTTQLMSDKIKTEGENLDQEIERIYKKTNDVIVNYKLLEIKDIKFLPYRTNYNIGDNYIEIEKYELLRDTFAFSRVLGINKKKIKVYISGESLSKVETEIVEEHLYTGSASRVLITDPSPATAGTDDISFTHISRNVKLLENKTLGEVKNNRVSPLRNDIKKEFIIPHITFLYDTLLDIAETYYKGVKDSDQILLDFLSKSTSY